MAMEYLEHELRKANKPGDKERAEIISAMKKGRGEDIQMPADKNKPEEISGSLETKQEVATAQAPDLILAGAETAILSTNIESLTKGAENTTALKSAISDITEPYYRMFKDKALYSYSILDRLKSLGGRRNLSTNWKHTMDVGDTHTGYKYHLEYTREHGTNVLKKLDLKFESEEDKILLEGRHRYFFPLLRLNFGQGEIAEVQLFFPIYHSNVLDKYSNDDLKEILKQFHSFSDSGTGLFGINLTGNPSFSIKEYYGKRVEKNESYAYSFDFQPETDNFKMFTIRPKTNPYEHLTLTNMASPKFLSFLRSTLELIPTEDFNKLRH